MTKKQIQQLAQISYADKQLDEKKVNAIVSKLKRKDLKRYIDALKATEQKRQVIIAIPKKFEAADKIKLEEYFPDKEISYTIDPSLLLGIKIINNDLVYEMSLNKTLEDLIDHVSEYD